MKNSTIIADICVGSWAYFGVLEKTYLSLETKAQLAEKDLTQMDEQHKSGSCNG